MHSAGACQLGLGGTGGGQAQILQLTLAQLPPLLIHDISCTHAPHSLSLPCTHAPYSLSLPPPPRKNPPRPLSRPRPLRWPGAWGTRTRGRTCLLTDMRWKHCARAWLMCGRRCWGKWRGRGECGGMDEALRGKVYAMSMCHVVSVSHVM